METFYTLIEKSKQAVRYWWLMLLVGIVLFATGCWVLCSPAESFLGMAILFGWLMFIVGILEVVLSTVTQNVLTGRGWMLVSGIIEIILGLILIFNVNLSALILPLYLGFWLMMRGITAIGFSGDMKSLGIPGSGWSIVAGILLLLFSIWILMQPVVFGATVVVVWVGISLLFAGIWSALFSFQLQKAHRHLSKEQETI